jgi:hypothetical protein
VNDKEHEYGTTDEGAMHDPLRHSRREEDNSLLAKVAAITIKYHWLGTFILIIFLALGFDFKTPASLFGEIREDIEEVKNTAETNREVAKTGLDAMHEQINELDRERATLKILMESSVIAQCLSLPKNVTRTAGLPCARLFRERGIE